MRISGSRLPAGHPSLNAPLHGHLSFGPSFRRLGHGKTWEARFCDASGNALAMPLFGARLVRIQGGALHIAGHEDHGRGRTKSRPEHHEQSWLIVFDLRAAQHVLERLPAGHSFDSLDDEGDDADYSKMME